eukprot:1195284-Prorocentrum_minimum.AAC.1
MWDLPRDLVTEEADRLHAHGEHAHFYHSNKQEALPYAHPQHKLYRPHLLISHTEDADQLVNVDEVFHPQEALLAAGRTGESYYTAEQQVSSAPIQ